MNRIIAIFLCGMLLSVTLIDSFFYADYLINKQYIAEFLCENKARPEMECNGKCHLSKQLKKAEEAMNEPFQAPSDKLDLEFFFSTADFLSEKHEHGEYHFAGWSDLEPPCAPGHQMNMFHPPQSV